MMKLFLSTLLFLMTAAAVADEPVNDGRRGAIGGHDALAYYADGLTANAKVTVGTKKHVVEWQGAKWRFASAAAADKFAADPRAFAPRYNGHCANALSLGNGLVKTDGSVWDFFGGRLHLFYAKAGWRRWKDGDWRAYQVAADDAWQAALKQH